MVRDFKKTAKTSLLQLQHYKIFNFTFRPTLCQKNPNDNMRFCPDSMSIIGLTHIAVVLNVCFNFSYIFVKLSIVLICYTNKLKQPWQQSLANAKVSARQTWYMGRNSLNHPSLAFFIHSHTVNNYTLIVDS